MSHPLISHENNNLLCTPNRHYLLSFIVASFFIYFLIDNFEFSPITRSRPIQTTVNVRRCSEIFEIKAPGTSNSDEILTSAMEDIALSKRLKRFLRYVAYYALSTFVPSLLKEQSPFDGTNYTITKKGRLDQMNWKIPYLPCQLRKYTADDVHTCIETRRLGSKTFRITFMGDSRLRRLMEYTAEFLHKFNFTIMMGDGTTITLDDLLKDNHIIKWPKYKQELKIESLNHPTFQMRFFWAPNLGRGDDGTDSPRYMNYLDEGVFSPLRRKYENSTSNMPAFDVNIKRRKIKGHSNDKLKGQIERGRNIGITDELNRLVKKTRAELPDIIIIDSGLWQLYHYDDGILYNIEKRAIGGIRKLFNALQELATKVTVAVLLPDPIKEYLTFFSEPGTYYFTIQNMRNLHWHLNTQIQLFPQNVLIWDSFLPLAYASITDCFDFLAKHVNLSSLPNIQRFDALNSYGCKDKIHTGYETLGIAFQMFINQICNLDMDKERGVSYCCES